VLRDWFCDSLFNAVVGKFLAVGGLAVFIYAGGWLVKRLHTSRRIINLIVGAVFIISAAIQLYRLLYKPLDQQLKVKVALVKPAAA